MAGLVAFAVYRADILFPKAKPNQQTGKITLQDLGQNAESPSGSARPRRSRSIASSRPSDCRRSRRPRATSVNGNTVRFALNVWAGWAPIILANNGTKAEKIWKTADGEEFKVELVIIDNPVAMLGAYTSGDVQIGWGTVDMVPLFIDGMIDKTGQPKEHFDGTMPRIFQQIDWSNGGDGIVVRDNIKTVANLGQQTRAGSELAVAVLCPEHARGRRDPAVRSGHDLHQRCLPGGGGLCRRQAEEHRRGRLLVARHLQPGETGHGQPHAGQYADGQQADRRRLVRPPDFAKDHPGIVEALVRGIFDGMVELKKDERKPEVSKLMAAAYNIPADDALAMLNDAHNTNWAENYQFFLNQNNPTNFERVWRQSYYLYRRIGTIQNPQVNFDKIMDFSVIQKLGGDPKYKSEKDEYQVAIAPSTVGKIRAEGDEILTNTVVIHFSPNDWDLHFKKPDGTLYDPNVDNVLEGVGKLVGTFGGARVIIEGHTDSSMKGQVPADVVKTLSMNRALAVRDALAAKYPDIDASRFYADGLGWDRPADSQNPFDQGRNRRVEIKVYPAEKQ